MRILLACDRSKGHLYPALSLAEYLKKNSSKYTAVFYGLKSGDKDYLRKEGFSCVGFDLSFRNIFLETFFRLLESLFLFIYLRPKKVLGFGGRNSFFIVLISSFFVPTFLFEPNVSLGKANKVLSFFVKNIFLGLRNPKRAKEINVGIPLRKKIIKDKRDKKEARKILGLCQGIKTFLVFGGSQGSVFINNTFKETALLLKEEGYKFQVIHITGFKDFEKIDSFYRKAKIEAKVFSFHQDIGILYSAADLVISRSGASSLAEICFFGLPSIIIPYPYAYAHQKKNASFLSKRKAVLLEEQKFLDPEKLFKLIKAILEKFEDFSFLSNNVKNQKIWKTSEEFSEKILDYI